MEEGRTNDIQATCPRCGTTYSFTPVFCMNCGGRISGPPNAPRTRMLTRKSLIALVASLVAVALLAGGIWAAVWLLDRPAPVKLPTTASELKASVDLCGNYLNEQGKEMAVARAKGATVYSVKAVLDTGAKTVSGQQSVLFTNRTGNELGEIVLRMYANDDTIRGSNPQATVTAVRAGGRDAAAALASSLLKITLPEMLAPGKEVLVSFSFKENIPPINSDIGGLLGMAGGETSGGFGIFGYTENVYNLGYLMPIVAAYKNGAWESRKAPTFGDVEDYECAYFNVSIDVPAGFKVAATGMPTAQSSGGGRNVYGFSGGPVRDFAVQASPDYEVATRRIGQTTVASYYLEKAEGTGKKVLDFGCDALSQYNKHFGPYPMKRLNLCEAPLAGGAAGMEFGGLIQLGQILYGDLGGGGLEGLGENMEGLEQLLNSFAGGMLGDTLEFVTAHEVCHQWWGLGVGGDAIGSPWQDESLTNYCSILYFRWQHGAEAAEQQLEQQLVLPFTVGLMFGGDTVVDQPVDSFASQEQYVAAVYSKGALFFEALENQMGPEAFEKSLQEYYRRYIFLNATPQDLVSAFEKNSANPAAVAALHRRWILEVHGEEDVGAGDFGGDYLKELMEMYENLDINPGDLDELLDQDGVRYPS